MPEGKLCCFSTNYCYRYVRRTKIKSVAEGELLFLWLRINSANKQHGEMITADTRVTHLFLLAVGGVSDGQEEE